MVKVLQEDSKIDIIKQGAQYRSIYTDRFTFGDCLNYSSPCNYTNYLKQWKITEEKSIFPYQYYSTIEELEAAVEFPPSEAFYNELKQQHVTEEEYQKSKNEYDSRRQLPGKHTIVHMHVYIYK